MCLWVGEALCQARVRGSLFFDEERRSYRQCFRLDFSDLASLIN